MNNRIRYTLDEIQRNIYYQMPKFLFEGELENLSNDARVLYSLLRDRHDLSIKNQWINENGEVYLIFSRENMCDMLKLSKPTVIKAMNDLKKYNLIEEKRLGQGKANQIYLLSVDTVLTYEKKPVTLENTEKSKIFTSENQGEISEVKNLYFKRENSFTSESQEILPQEVKNFYPINNDFKEIEFNNTESNPIESNRFIETVKTVKEKTDTIDMIDTIPTQSVLNENEQKNKASLKNATADQSNKHLDKPSAPKYNYNQVEEIIKTQIDYDYLIEDNTARKETLDEIVFVITTTICTEYKDGYISMGEERVPAEAVRAVFFKLGYEHIEYFLDCFNRQTEIITKLPPYIRKSLYYNYGTVSHHYTNRVHHDIPQLAARKL